MKFKNSKYPLGLTTHKKWEMDRRTFLRGMGFSLALPFLDVMLPSVLRESFAAGTDTSLRFGVIMSPNGLNMNNWMFSDMDAQSNTLFNGPFPRFELLSGLSSQGITLPATLSSLSTYQNLMNVYYGLIGAPAGAGMSDAHDTAMGNILACAPITPTQGITTADEIIRQTIGSPDGVHMCAGLGYSDPGGGTRLHTDISWKNATTCTPANQDIIALVDNLFQGVGGGGGANATLTALQKKKKIVDFVLPQANEIKRKLPYTDRTRVDQVLEGYSSLQDSLAKMIADQQNPVNQVGCGKPTYAHTSYVTQVDCFVRLFTLILQCSYSRVATLLYAPDGSKQRFDGIVTYTQQELDEIFANGYNNGADKREHHNMSHHSSRPAILSGVAKIDKWHFDQTKKILDGLSQITEGNGKTVLENSVLLIGAPMSNGQDHLKRGIPLMTVGSAGGRLKTGYRAIFDKGIVSSSYPYRGGEPYDGPYRPHGDLILTLAQVFGANITSMGTTGTNPINGLKV